MGGFLERMAEKDLFNKHRYCSLKWAVNKMSVLHLTKSFAKIFQKYYSWIFSDWPLAVFG